MSNTKKSRKKELRRAVNEAIKHNHNNKKELVDAYIQAQKDTRSAIEQNNKEEVLENISKIVKEGGTKSKTFWKAKRKAEGKNNDSNYTTVKEDGTPIDDPQETKNHIANFFENLYQAREGKPEYKEWTAQIKETVKVLAGSEEMKKEIQTITFKISFYSISAFTGEVGPGSKFSIEKNEKDKAKKYYPIHLHSIKTSEYSII